MDASGEKTAKGAGALGGFSAPKSDGITKSLVSVLTPVYNGEAYIGRLLKSVLAQTYPRIEMILADDGSTDKTIEKAAAYIPAFEEKGYTLTIVRAAHKNASAAINAGLPYVKGKYLVWPDADDELLPESIETRVKFLEAHPGYRCVRSLMEYASHETGELLRPVERVGDIKKEEIFWDVLEGKSFVCCGCYMLEAAEFFRIYPQKRIPEYEVGQNFQMLLPFLFYNKCPTLPETQYRVNIRADSHSQRQRTEAEETRRYRDFERLLDEILHICNAHHAPTAAARVKLWKLERRKNLAWQYHHMIQFHFYRIATKILKILQKALTVR